MLLYVGWRADLQLNVTIVVRDRSMGQRYTYCCNTVWREVRDTRHERLAMRVAYGFDAPDPVRGG